MDQLGQILDERRRSSSRSNNGDGAPPQSSPRRAIPRGPESASDDDDSNLMAAEILAVTPSPPPAKKPGRRREKDKTRTATVAAGRTTNPFDDDGDEQNGDNAAAAVSQKSKAKAKSQSKSKSSSKKSSSGGESTTAPRKTSGRTKGGRRLRPPQPKPATNPFDDDHRPPPSPTKGGSHRRSKTAPTATATAGTAALQAKDEQPPPIGELSIRTRSFSSARGRTKGAGGGGDDSSLHAVYSVMSGRSGKSSKSKASTNPFDDDPGSDASSNASDASAGDDEDEESSAASTQVSELSARSARSVALAAALRVQAERYRAEAAKRDAAAAAAKTRAKGEAEGDGDGNDDGNDEKSEESRWEEGSDGEWRRVGGSDQKKAAAATSGVAADGHGEDGGRWEEGSDGEWRRVVDDGGDKTDTEDTPDTNDAPKDAATDQPSDKASKDEEEESSRELWEEGSDGEWRRVVKSAPSNDDKEKGPTHDDVADDAPDDAAGKPGANEVDEKAAAAKDDEPADATTKDDVAPQEEEGVWEEDSDGEWKLVPRTKPKEAPAESVKVSIEGESEHADEEEVDGAAADQAETKVTGPRKQKLDPFDDSSSGSGSGSDGDGDVDKADEASRSSSGPVDLDGSSDSDSDDASKPIGDDSGPIDLDEVDSIDNEEKDGSGPIDLDEVDSLVPSDQSQKDSSSSSSDSDSAENDSDELDDELREQIERRRAEEAAAAAVAATTNAHHPLLAAPKSPRYALDHSGPVPSLDTSTTGPSLLARANAKREVEERLKAELAEKKAKEREMIPPRGIPQAIGGASFDATSTVMSPGDQKSCNEVSTTANSTMQRSIKSYGEQSEASSANAVAILPSLVNVQALSDLDRIPSGRRIDHFSPASPSHRSVGSQSQGSPGSGSGAANALSAREAIMAAASRHRSRRFGTSSSRGHSARVSFDSNDPTASVKSVDSSSTGPSQSAGKPPLLDRSSRASSLNKKFMTPLERQRELRRSQRMTSSAVEGAATIDQGRFGSSGSKLGDGLSRLEGISGEDVSVAARGDEFSIAPSLGGTVATAVTDKKGGGRDVKMDVVPEAAESAPSQALPSLDETGTSAAPFLREFNAGLLRGFADNTAIGAEAPVSPAQSPGRAASSPGSSPRRRMNSARSKMKNVLSTMATVDKMKESPTKQSPTKQSPRRILVRPNFQKEEQDKSDDKVPASVSSTSLLTGQMPAEESSAEESEAESDCDDESLSQAIMSFSEPSKPTALPLRLHPEYSKYFAMLKASVPPSFVRRVCEIDGRDPSVLDMDPDTPYEPRKTTGLHLASNDTEGAQEEVEVDDSEDEPLKVATDENDSTAEPTESQDPSPRGVAEVHVPQQTSEEYGTGVDETKVATLVVGLKPPRPPPGKLSDSGKGDVAALFATRASELDAKPKASVPRTLKDSGKGDVAKLFAARAGESDEAKEKPKPGKLSDTGKGNVAAMFAARSAEAGPSTKKDQAKPGKLSDSGKGDVAALFAARSKATKPSATPAVGISTSVSAAAEKIEQQEQENKDATRPPLKNDPEFAKYFKMISMGIPMGAVQQALARDGKDPSTMEMDHDKPYSPKPETKVSTRPPLRDDPEFAKYFKMLKMGLPMGAVKQAMSRDGADPSVLDMDHDKPLPSTSSAKEDTSSAKKTTPGKPKVLRKKLFWTSIDKSKLDKDSLWAQAQQESQNLEGLDYDMEEFASLFTQQKGKKGKSPSKDGPKRKKKALVHLIDGRREMNGSIVLRKFKHDYKQLADDLRRLDVGNMDENEVRAHMQLLPTKEEIKAIEAYLSKSKTEEEKEEAISKLGECEKYMIAMMGVQDAAKRFQCLLYRAQFDTRVEEIENEVKDLKEACKCVRSSDRLRKLLVLALRLGNTLNTDGSEESASAITLDSLLKMHESKAFDKQTSVLHYLVSIIEKNDKDVLNIKEDLEPAKKAERIVVESLKKSLADLSNGLDTVNEMGMEEAQRQAKGKGDKNLVADVNSVLAQTNIGQFAISADVRLKVLSAELDEAVEACTGLLTYFGEDSVMPTDVFFSTLNGFIAMFGTALEDNRRREKAKARKAKMAERQKAEGGTAGSRPNSFTLRSDSESSLSDSRSKILFELQSGGHRSKLKPVGQSSARKLSVDAGDSSEKDDNKKSKEKNTPPASTGDDAGDSEKDAAKSDETKGDDDSDGDEDFEDAVETEDASETEEHKEECVIS